MRKKKVVIFVLTILLLAIVVFWFLGKKEEEKKLQAEREVSAQYESIIKHNSFLESIVINTYTQNKDQSITSPSTFYTTNNLNVNEESTLADVEIYAEDIKKALTPYTEPRPNEATLVLEALKTNDLTQLKSLDTSLNLHQTALASLLQIETPVTAQIVHLRLTNNIKDQIDLLTQMKNLNQNPEQALEAALDYPVVASSFFQATNNINIYLENRGITFTENERLNLFYNI